MNKLDDDRSYSLGNQARSTISLQCRPTQANILRENYRNTLSLSQDETIDPFKQELTVLNSIGNHI